MDSFKSMTPMDDINNMFKSFYSTTPNSNISSIPDKHLIRCYQDLYNNPANDYNKSYTGKQMTDYTAIIFLLDRSGSMYSIKKSVIGSLNTLIEDQKKVKNNDIFYMAQFNDTYETLYTWTTASELVPIKEAKYKTNGSTALYDSMGKTINEAGVYFNSLTTKPSKVLFITITDGEENCSTEFSRNRLAEMINHQTEVYSWDFSFIGSNFDVNAEGARLNIRSVNTMSFDSTSVGVKNMSSTLSSGVTNYRTTATRDVLSTPNS